MHYVEPHAPYRLQEDFAGRLGIHVGKSEVPRQDRYDTEIAFTDQQVGRLLATVERDPWLAANTLIVFAADHGESLGEHSYWGHGRNLYEPTLRIPLGFVWPGRIKPGTVTVELMSHNDWIPTLCAIAGESDIVHKLKQGYTANGVAYKVHLDGYDQSRFLTSVEGTVGRNNGVKSARDHFFYSDDDGLLVGYRKGDYKYVYSEQRLPGTMGVWAEPFTTLRLQKIFNLMQDPYERADITSNTFWDWQIDHVGSMYGVMDEVFQFAATFDEFPPRSFPPSFNPANVMEQKLRVIRGERVLRELFPMLPEAERPEN